MGGSGHERVSASSAAGACWGVPLSIRTGAAPLTRRGFSSGCGRGGTCGVRCASTSDRWTVPCAATGALYYEMTYGDRGAGCCGGTPCAAGCDAQRGAQGTYSRDRVGYIKTTGTGWLLCGYTKLTDACTDCAPSGSYTIEGDVRERSVTCLRHGAGAAASI